VRTYYLTVRWLRKEDVTCCTMTSLDITTSVTGAMAKCTCAWVAANGASLGRRPIPSTRVATACPSSRVPSREQGYRAVSVRRKLGTERALTDTKTHRCKAR
jgi:hypothetical protein